jgi:hypothetical protein
MGWMRDRTGRTIFVIGIACLLFSVALSLLRSRHTPSKFSQRDLEYDPRIEVRAYTPEIKTVRFFLSNENALMWMVFGLGVCLSLVGLRMLTSPTQEVQPMTPLGSIRDVFEKSD